MSLFKKRDDTPELPRAPTLPKLSEPISRAYMLPAITSKANEKLGNDMVKSAVTDEDHMNHFQEHASLPVAQVNSQPVTEHSHEDHQKDVFVKLDKFTQAQKTFFQMKNKLEQIEILVQKAEQINEKEKSELTSWNTALNDLKSKVREIDSEVFNQI